MGRPVIEKQTKLDVYKRFREQFVNESDSDVARMIGKDRQQLLSYKTGRNSINFTEIADILPNLDYNYILTGRRIDNMEVIKELSETRTKLSELEKNLQMIEKKIITK